MAGQESDEIEMIMESSEDAKTITIVVTKKTPIFIEELIVALEGYLMELTRAEKDRRAPGVCVH